MEDIITKLDKISTFVNALNEEDKKNFNNDSKTQIDKLNEITINIENMLKDYDLPEENCKENELKEKRDKLVMKQLFICYWYIKKKIDTMSIAEILEFEKAITQ